MNYEIKNPRVADKQEIFWDRDSLKLSYKNDLGIIKSLEGSGATGPQGPQGPQGPTGPQGVPGPVGPAGLNWQGSWSALNTYVVDDAVGYDGASWFCINPVGPTTDTPDIDTANWALLASEGAVGPQGPQGIAGPNEIVIDTTTISAGGDNNILFELGGVVTEDSRFYYDPTTGSLVNSGNSTDASNVSMGQYALVSITDGSSNTALGNSAMPSLLEGYDNIAIGPVSLQNVPYGSNNIAIGNNALGRTSSVINGAIAIGREALAFNAGTGSTAIGYQAASPTVGDYNTVIGFQSALNLITGTNNVSLGALTLGGVETGINNVAIGTGAMGTIAPDASQNVALGTYSLAVNAGEGNVGVGFNTLGPNVTGNYNTAIGSNAGQTNSVGQYNTLIGASTDSGDYNGSVVLGFLAAATNNNQFVVGSVPFPAGNVATETNTSSKVWNVIINGVAQKILLA
jgi:hypothetical protein